MRRCSFGFTFPTQFVSTAYRYLSNPQVASCYAIKGATPPAVKASWFASGQTNKKWFRVRSPWFLFPTVVTFGGAVLYQMQPGEKSFAYEQFMTNTTGENKCIENYLRWKSILLMTGVFDKLSHYDAPFYLSRSFVEHHLEFWYHTVFHENKNNRVYFRGEYKKDADELLSDCKHRIPLPYSLCSGEFSLPYVKDQTLESGGSENTSSYPNGFTKGVISLTSSIEVSGVYGNSEAVLFVVPQGRVAPVAHHATKDAQNFQYEYICGGIRRQDILFIGYRDSATQEFNGVKFNPAFEGDIDKLELDPQMESVIDVIPDDDARKARLKARINPDLDYRDSYDQLVADDEHSHKTALPGRLKHVATHGFNGNRLLRSLHRQYHGVKWDHTCQQMASTQSSIYFSYGTVVPPIPESNRRVLTESLEESVVTNNASISSVSSASQKRNVSFSSPRKTYSQLNFRAQKDIQQLLENVPLSPSKVPQDREEELAGIGVSKRAMLGSAYAKKAQPLSKDEQAALDDFKFETSLSGDVSMETETKPAHATALHLDGVKEVYSDSDSDSDDDNEEQSNHQNKRLSMRSVESSSRKKVDDVLSSTSCQFSLFANRHIVSKSCPENRVVFPVLDGR